MKLIDQTAKTNWKFIAIVVVLSLVVGILVLWVYIADYKATYNSLPGGGIVSIWEILMRRRLSKDKSKNKKEKYKN